MHAFGHARSFCTRDPRDHLAERPSGNISGVVTDANGAVVPGATVAATNAAIALTRSVTTNGEGVYTFANLPVGTL